jgi:hypothetical protein
MSYPITNAVNLPTPIGGILNGSYINFNSLPESIKILLSNPKYVVLVREREITQTSGGGRTIGTVWYNKQVLGFTVEDAVRNKKIALKTAIPDTIEDTSKFNGIPSNVYNIILSTYTSKEFIRKSFYNGKGMRVSSKGDPSGGNIYESDVFVSDNFATDKGRVAFDGVFIHQGSSENSSAGCIIFSKTRNNDGTLISSETAVQNLNKYLQSIKLIGPGKLQQFAIINLFELPEPPTVINAPAVIINSETNQPIQGVKVEITNPFEGGLNSSPSQSPFGSPSIELQEPPPLNTP